jgi:hypothetical protein
MYIEFFRWVGGDEKSLVSLFRCQSANADVTSKAAGTLTYTASSVSCVQTCVPNTQGGNRACNYGEMPRY